MVDAFTVYLVVVGTLPILFMAVYTYYELDTAAGRPLRKRGLTGRGLVATTVLSLGTVLVFGFLGSVDIFDTPVDLRGVMYPTIGYLIPLAVGLAGCNAAVTFAGRWRRLHPENDVPTGTLGPAEVACSGDVTDATVGSTPVTGRPAVCWSWRVEVVNPHGVGTQGDNYVTVDGADGGVVFAVDDGSVPVRVDPDDATLDLGARRTRSLAAADPPGDEFTSPAPKVERTHGDKPRRYEESLVAPGDHVAVAGTARTTDRGLVVGGPDAHVALGTRSTVATRYRDKAALYGIAGLVGTAVGVRLLAGLYGVF